MDGFCSAPLPVGTVPALVYGDTRTGFDTQTTCGLGIGGAGERNYRITVPTAGELTIDLTNLSVDAGFKPVIGVYTNCQFTSGYPRGCVPSHPSREVTRLVMPALDAGTYLVAVDGFDAVSGDFSLSMCLRPTRASSAGDTCASAIPLVFNAQTAVAEGNTLGMNDDVGFVRDDGLTCLGEIDRVYLMDLPDAGPGGVWDVHARARPLTDLAFDPSLVLIDACPDAGVVDSGVIACGTGVGGSPPFQPFSASLNHHLGTGRHFLLLQGFAAIQGRPEASYELDVKYARVGSVSNDLCGASSPGLLSNTSYAGTLLGATNQLDQPVCADLSGQNGAGAEVFYRYVAPATGMATFELEPEVGTSFYLGVFSACAASSCLTMQNANGVQGETRTTLPVVQGTTYYLMVEEYDVVPTPATIANGNRGAFGLRVTQ